MGSSGSLRGYVLTRLLLTIPMVWILLTIVFCLMRVAPGDPISAALGGKVAPAELAERRAEAGFDRPLIAQYGDYLSEVVQGNLGESITDNRPVTDILLVNGLATVELTFFALLVALGVGIPLGLLAGRYRDTGVDTASRLFGIVSYAMPAFFVGLLAQLVFGVALGWLPTSGESSPVVEATLPERTHIVLIDALLAGDTSAFFDALQHLILPAVTLGIVLAGVFIRLVRVNLIQTLRSDYVEAARARGIRERGVVLKHGFRNALVPVITVMGLQAALLLSGAVLTENTFNWPGIGNALLVYLNNRDYTAVQGIITAFALVVVGVSLLIDLLAATIDPRVRY
jgi:peptide/nickel transport system permease protein